MTPCFKARIGGVGSASAKKRLDPPLLGERIETLEDFAYASERVKNCAISGWRRNTGET
jgi:hypothetical protein